MPGDELLGLRIAFDSEGAISGLGRFTEATDAAATRTEASARRMVGALGSVDPALEKVGVASGRAGTTAAQIEKQFVGLSGATKSAKESAEVFTAQLPKQTAAAQPAVASFRQLADQLHRIPGAAGEAIGATQEIFGALGTIEIL